MASQNLAAIAPDEYDLSRELTQQLLAKARLKRFAKGESLFHGLLHWRGQEWAGRRTNG